MLQAEERPEFIIELYRQVSRQTQYSSNRDNNNILGVGVNPWAEGSMFVEALLFRIRRFECWRELEVSTTDFRYPAMQSNIITSSSASGSSICPTFLQPSGVELTPQHQS